MRKFLQFKLTAVFLFLAMVTGVNMNAQFSENMGTSTAGTTAIGSNAFQNGSPIVFTGSADTRNNLPSSGYAGASGGRNVFITNVVGRDFQISGINTSNYTGITLTYGLNKSTGSSGGTELVVEYSTTGGAPYTALTTTGTTGSNNVWFLKTATGIPAAENLTIRFRQTSTSPQFRVDDVKLTGTAAPTNAPLLAITGNTAHGSVCPNTSGASIQYTITNTGTVAATGVTVTAGGTDASMFAVSGLSST
ncbi:MAG: hypothetical protein EOO45_24520, partial [Flavobacterium sp.]